MADTRLDAYMGVFCNVYKLLFRHVSCDDDKQKVDQNEGFLANVFYYSYRGARFRNVADDEQIFRLQSHKKFDGCIQSDTAAVVPFGR